MGVDARPRSQPDLVADRHRTRCIDERVDAEMQVVAGLQARCVLERGPAADLRAGQHPQLLPKPDGPAADLAALVHRPALADLELVQDPDGRVAQDADVIAERDGPAIDPNGRADLDTGAETQAPNADLDARRCPKSVGVGHADPRAGPDLE